MCAKKEGKISCKNILLEVNGNSVIRTFNGIETEIQSFEIISRTVIGVTVFFDGTKKFSHGSLKT